MKKIKIMNQINVYRDIFSDEDLNLLMHEIENSYSDISGIDPTKPEDSSYYNYHGPQPQDRKDGSIIQTWAPWYTFGSRSIWGYPKDINATDNQTKGHKLLLDAMMTTYKDYVEEYADNGEWTYNIKDWSIGDSEESSLCLSGMEILKHRRNLDSEYTIGVHTDWHSHRNGEPGPKQLLTFTMYLNDDYDGGEIDFADENDKHLIIYKPKRGDITVFPAGQPYWHGARAVTSEKSKIFIRNFVVYRNPVSPEWIKGLTLYGPVDWMSKHSEKMKAIVDSGSVGRQIVFEGQEPNLSKNTDPLFVTKETYIDGRTI